MPLFDSGRRILVRLPAALVFPGPHSASRSYERASLGSILSRIGHVTQVGIVHFDDPGRFVMCT